MTSASNRSDPSRVLLRQDYDLPKTIPGLTSLIREIVEQGENERIIVDQQSVRAWVWVERNEMMEDQNEITLDTALSAAKFVEYNNPNDDKTASEVLYHMTHVMSSERLFPVCWVSGNEENPDVESLLSRWAELFELGLSSDVKKIFGIDLVRLKTIPEETLILCCSTIQDGDFKDITLAIKTTIEVRSERKKNEPGKLDAYDDRGGPSPKGHDQAANQVESHPSGDGGSRWSPTGFLRSQLNRGV